MQLKNFGHMSVPTKEEADQGQALISTLEEALHNAPVTVDTKVFALAFLLRQVNEEARRGIGVVRTDRKTLFHGPVWRVDQDGQQVYLIDQWNLQGISSHVHTSELSDAISAFASALSGDRVRLMRDRTEEECFEDTEKEDQ